MLSGKTADHRRSWGLSLIPYPGVDRTTATWAEERESGEVRQPANALALVALELLVGTFVLMWISMLVWKVIDRGHYRATTWVVFPFTIALGFALPASLRPAAWATAAAQVGFLVAVYSQRPLLEWAIGALAGATGVWLVAQAGLRSCATACVSGAVQALIGTAFLGAVTHGMVLGHWYLNQPRLPIEPLKGSTRIMLGALGGSLLAGLADRADLVQGVVPAAVLAFSAASYWWTWLLLLAGTGLLALAVRSTVWSRSTQSATGLLYIAVIVALGAQFIISLLATG